MPNNQIASIRKYRKKWQDKVVTWFNQPARKERRRAGEQAADCQPSITAGSSPSDAATASSHQRLARLRVFWSPVGRLARLIGAVTAWEPPRRCLRGHAEGMPPPPARPCSNDGSVGCSAVCDKPRRQQDQAIHGSNASFGVPARGQRGRRPSKD
jgi:hypothetical protein